MKRKWILFGITLGVLVAGTLIGYLLIHAGLRFPCMLFELTGIQCPGCGNTRATLALLQLDIRGMLNYNFIYPLELLFLLRIYWVCAKNYLRGGRFAYPVKSNWLDISFLILLLCWTVYRNLLPVPVF